MNEALDREFEQRLASMRDQDPAPFTHLIDGKPSAEGETLQRDDPCGQASHARRLHAAEESTVALAVRSSREVAPVWRRTPHSERCSLLRALAAELSARHVELAAAISLETGKIRVESLAEVQEALDLIDTYCTAMEVTDGYSERLTSLAEGEHNFETLRPYGTFGVIAPFNFPLALAVNMASAALIAGNTVVLKPSQATPWTGALLGRAALDAGLPPGVFNLVQGGSDTGRALAVQDIDGIAFTGSAQAGGEIASRLASGPYARPLLAEMGGKNAAIVSHRADLGKAAEGIARAAFGFSGQKCSSCSRAIVLDDVYDEFMQALLDFTATLSLDDPSVRTAALGPVIDEAAVERFHASVVAARADGRVLCGGVQDPRAGRFLEPTVIDGLPFGHPLSRNELFLPLLVVQRVGDLSAAIEHANAVDYGLSAGIFSEDDQEVERFLDEMQAGVLYVNRRAGATTGAWPGSQSFCGWKASGITGKGGLGSYYLPQFMREQSRTIVS